MPTIRITTRSSMRVKPPSSFFMRLSILGLVLLLHAIGLTAPKPRPRSQATWWQLGFLAFDFEARGFASRPHERFALGHLAGATAHQSGRPSTAAFEAAYQKWTVVLSPRILCSRVLG